MTFTHLISHLYLTYAWDELVMMIELPAISAGSFFATMMPWKNFQLQILSAIEHVEHVEAGI